MAGSGRSGFQPENNRLTKGSELSCLFVELFKGISGARIGPRKGSSELLGATMFIIDDVPLMSDDGRENVEAGIVVSENKLQD